MARYLARHGDWTLAQDEGPSVTPYRPSVSTAATLSAPAWLELEVGGLRARAGDPNRRASLPYKLKLALTPDWGVRLGGEAWVRQTDAAGTHLAGGGDTSVVLKRRIAIDDKRAFGIELGANFATAANALGSGRDSIGWTGIYSADLPGGLHTDVNLVATRATSVDAASSRIQPTFLSCPIGKC